MDRVGLVDVQHVVEQHDSVAKLLVTKPTSCCLTQLCKMISLNYTENYFHFSRVVRQQLIITYLEHKEERERMMMLWNNYSDFHYRT